MFGIGSLLFLLFPLNIFITRLAEGDISGAIITAFIGLAFWLIIPLLI